MNLPAFSAPIGLPTWLPSRGLTCGTPLTRRILRPTLAGGSGGGGARMTAASAAGVSTSPLSAAGPLIDLRGKRALVTGIANQRSIAWGVAQQLAAAGATLGVTYLPVNEKVEGKVRALTAELQPSLFAPLDVTKASDLDALAEAVRAWGGLDVLVHCLAFADRKDLMGSFAGTSRDGFRTALEVSAYSLVEMCGRLRPLMRDRAAVLTLSYLGAVRVVPNYNIMGVAKAALESSVRYLANEFGPDGIRVNGISAGPIKTLSSAAIGGISAMIKNVEANAPLRRTVTQKEVGNAAAFLLSDAASGLTGQILYVDAGYEIMGAPSTAV